MTSQTAIAPSSMPAGQDAAPRNAAAGGRLAAIGLGVAVGYLGALAAMFAAHRWVLGADGRPLLTDFTAVWSAGRLALRGAALSAYDGAAQHAAEVAVIGHGFQGFYGWPYPPSVLFAAAGLASLPYLWAFALWVGGAFLLHGAAVAAITRRPAAALVALASPWALASLMVGQNGFLTAALIGAVLLTLDRRPALSGLLLGFLTYKPQFGLLFPLALAVSGRWRVMAWAAAGALGLNGVACAVFGVDTLTAFVRDLPQTTQTLVADGGVGFSKLQSVYGLMRCLGAPNVAAGVAQAMITGVCALAVAWLWRGRAPFALKAAGLAVATVLATPYVFAYDLVLLTVPMAFLWRHRPFDRLDYWVLGLAALAVVPFVFAPAPSGLLASLLVAAAVARRLVAARAEAPSSDLLPRSALAA
jgi:hypothetical protein